MRTYIRRLSGIMVAAVLVACRTDTSGGIGGGGPTLDASPWYTEDTAQVDTQTSYPTPVSATLTETATSVPDTTLSLTPSPSIIEVTPLGGYGRTAGVAQFSNLTMLRDCSSVMWVGVDKYDIEGVYIGTDAYQPSPYSLCPPARYEDGDVVTIPVGAVADFAYFYHSTNGELWGVSSAKNYYTAALCFGNRSRAVVWLSQSLYDWDHGGHEKPRHYACQVVD